MAYKRFGDDSDLYIWASSNALNVWIAHFSPKTKLVQSGDGLVELKFDEHSVKEAQVLMKALYDFCQSQGINVEISKKTKEIKFSKNRK